MDERRRSYAEVLNCESVQKRRNMVWRRRGSSPRAAISSSRVSDSLVNEQSGHVIPAKLKGVISNNSVTEEVGPDE